jgi:cholesterol transport system auxiliary component
MEFYHDAASAPSRVRITMTAELTDPVARVLLARRVFDQSAAARTNDAPGAVQAFGDAIAAILGDICAWVDASAPR